MRTLLKLFVFVIPISVLLVSCYPEFDASVSELDLAITKYDEGQDFTELSSFFLYDTVIYITDDEKPVPHFDHTQGPHIIAQTRENLLRLGWTENTDTIGGIKADVSIILSALEVDVNFYYTYWWDWWYWYPWYPGYPGYPGWPGYPSYPTYPSYGYTVGTVLTQMVDMGAVNLPSDPDNPRVEIPIVWTGAVNGILAGSDENIENRLTKQMKQVFDQSTYLYKKTPKDE